MKVYLRNIPPEGLVIEQSYPPEALGLQGEEFQVRSPIVLVVNVDKAGDQLCVNVQATATYGLTCWRCLAEEDQSRTDRFDIYCDIEPSTEFVDLDDEFRQELIVCISATHFLCRPECRGLCPNCGKNLNRETCVCPADLKNPVVLRPEQENDNKPKNQ